MACPNWSVRSFSNLVLLHSRSSCLQEQQTTRHSMRLSFPVSRPSRQSSLSAQFAHHHAQLCVALCNTSPFLSPLPGSLASSLPLSFYLFLFTIAGKVDSLPCSVLFSPPPPAVVNTLHYTTNGPMRFLTFRAC